MGKPLGTYKKSLKLHLNLSTFKLYTIPPKKRQFILADTHSSWKDTFKAPSWKDIMGLSTHLKTSSLDFSFNWLVFVIDFMQ